jgi:hypothetical protein
MPERQRRRGRAPARYRPRSGLVKRCVLNPIQVRTPSRSISDARRECEREPASNCAHPTPERSDGEEECEREPALRLHSTGLRYVPEGGRAVRR